MVTNTFPPPAGRPRDTLALRCRSTGHRAFKEHRYPEHKPAL